MAVDGSKIILPNTKENTAAFGRFSASANPTKNQSKPVGGLLSTLHDCLNNTFLDMQFGSCTLSEMALAAKGIHLDIRAVPNDKSIDAMELLKKY